MFHNPSRLRPNPTPNSSSNSTSSSPSNSLHSGSSTSHNTFLPSLTSINHRQQQQQQQQFQQRMNSSSFSSSFSLPTTHNVTSSVIKSSSRQPSPQQPQVKRSIVLFSICLSFTIFIILQIAPSPFSRNAPADASTSAHHLLSAPGDDDPLRHSQAALHFRKSLTHEQLDEYYAKKEQALKQLYPDLKDDQRALILPRNASTQYFQSCFLSSDTSTLHPSLRRGPDSLEIKGRARAKQPRDFDDIFATVDRRRYLFHPDRQAVQTIDFLGAGINRDFDDAIKIAKAVTEHDLNAIDNQVHNIENIDVPIGYIRTTRQEGWQAIINFSGTTLKNDSTKSYVRRMVTVTRGYGTACETSLVRPREMVRINVVLPYSNRPYRIYAFMKMFDQYYEMLPTSGAKLLKIIIACPEEEVQSITKVIRKFEQFATDDLFNERVLIVTSKGDEFGNFSRAVAIRDAVKNVASDEVIFISDADLLIHSNFMQNCRVNVIRGSQVFFPIMFSLFPYGKGLSSRDGMWRKSSYGMVCMYKSDFDAVKGFGPDEESKFTGWGSEDVYLYNRFRDNEKYAVLRALEPGLQHQWHGKTCERNEHYIDCMRTVYMTIGSQDAIAKLMVDSKVDISNLTKNAIPV